MFGNMFNDISVNRYDRDGNIIQTLVVPIAYGPREKFLARLKEDPYLDREVAITLPRLSFEITNLQYASDRSLNKMNNVASRGSGANVLAQSSTPVPYDISVTLHGMFATQEDAVQVVEQILPFFRPEWTHTLKVVDDLDHYIDVPTVLSNMQVQDSYEADFQTRRAILYTFDFIIKGYLYGPVSNKGVIKRTAIDLIEGEVGDSTITRVDLQPGLKNDGTATTNRDESVSLNRINATDTYGFAFDNENFFNGNGGTE